MTSRQPTITGELRKWRRDILTNTVSGQMYGDTKQIWFDGEAAVVQFDRWEEGSTYYLAVTKLSAIKCPKDEEHPDASERNSGAP